MQISIWPEDVAQNGRSIYDRLLTSMRRTDDLIDRRYSGDAGFIWSVLWYNRMASNKAVWDHYRSQNKPVIVAEVGGLVRNKTWRLSANGITRDAIFPKVKLDPLRPKHLGLELKPWHDGDYVLICGQHGKSQQWESMPPMNDYYKQTVLEVRKYTDRPIVIRSHPRYRENVMFKLDQEFFDDYKIEWNSPKVIVNTYDSFDIEHILAHSHCVISHSSNSGISAILAGTPAIVSMHSLAFPVANSRIGNIEQLSKPDRNDWLIELSHKEWFEEELEYAWKNLRNLLIT